MLISAGAGGHASCVRVLVAAGCDINLTNDVGLSGQELAEQLKRDSIMTALVCSQPAAAPSPVSFDL